MEGVTLFYGGSHIDIGFSLGFILSIAQVQESDGIY